MPNHCNNTLSFMGTEEEVNNFIQFVKKPGANGEEHYEIFNSIIPMPEELKNTNKTFKESEVNKELKDKYGYDNWYDWCNYHWGTKWGDYETTLEGPFNYTYDEYEKYAVFKYDTAWAPGSDQIMPAIAELFPTMVFHLFYEEPGMAFEGYVTVREGQVTSEREREMIRFPTSVTDPYFDME